jgi:hypothetical protein
MARRAGKNIFFKRFGTKIEAEQAATNFLKGGVTTCL